MITVKNQLRFILADGQFKIVGISYKNLSYENLMQLFHFIKVYTGYLNFGCKCLTTSLNQIDINNSNYLFQNCRA